jgi:hypothetical protein
VLILYHFNHALQIESYAFAWASLAPQSSYPCLSGSWNYRCEALCPALLLTFFVSFFQGWVYFKIVMIDIIFITSSNFNLKI